MRSQFTVTVSRISSWCHCSPNKVGLRKYILFILLKTHSLERLCDPQQLCRRNESLKTTNYIHPLTIIGSKLIRDIQVSRMLLSHPQSKAAIMHAATFCRHIRQRTTPKRERDFAYQSKKDSQVHMFKLKVWWHLN